jgi:magnesium transporter
MAFVSDLIGKPVADVDGVRVGRVNDLIAQTGPDVPHPLIVALAVKGGRKQLLIPMTDVVVLLAPAIPLRKRLHEIDEYEVRPTDVQLARDIFDKQIIDTGDMRVVRVNDLELMRVKDQFVVANVDIGGMGLLRRLGLARTAQGITTRLGRTLPPGIIAWDAVELVPGNEPLRLKVPSEKLAELHPADLADIVSELSRQESNRLLESFDAKTVADTLEEVEPDFQASLVRGMPDERVADVLEEMSPDEAADLLAELPEQRSQQILRLMETEEADDVRKLLTYPVDAAGGIMTTEFIAVGPDLTAEETMAVLRASSEEVGEFFYVYVVNGEGRLIGVFTLQDLVLAPPTAQVKEFMQRRVFAALLSDSQDSVAHAVSKYNLMAIPVVDDEGRLQGVVTADDALDKIIPTAWKKRLPRMYR